MGFFTRLWGRRTPPPVPPKASVTFDDVGVQHTQRDGHTECITWSDLQRVVIVATEGGPYEDDVFWSLIGAGHECVVSSETEGAQQLLVRLQELPGFKHEAVVQAMGSTELQMFLCWQRNNTTD